MSQMHDAHIHAWRAATCPGMCWRCPEASMRVRLVYQEHIVSPIPSLGEGRTDLDLLVCRQKRQPVSLISNVNWGDDGGCQRGGCTVPTDLVTRDTRAPSWV